MNTDLKILQQREYFVIKQNDLIQKSRMELSLPEQKTIAYICSMIKPASKNEPQQLEYQFNIRDYCKVCGMDYDNGKNYADIRTVLKKLRDKSMLLEIDGDDVTVAWLSKVRTNKKSGNVTIILDDDIVPYLFNLREKYTQYQLFFILGMKSSFSIKIYELMKSYLFNNRNKTEVTYNLDDLKKVLMVSEVKSYKEYAPFRQKVLEVAEREINELSDLTMGFEPIKKGNKVIGVKFYIGFKNVMDRFIVGEKIHKQLELNL